jgi:hypothetical protein
MPEGQLKFLAPNTGLRFSQTGHFYIRHIHAHELFFFLIKFVGFFIFCWKIVTYISI